MNYAKNLHAQPLVNYGFRLTMHETYMFSWTGPCVGCELCSRPICLVHKGRGRAGALFF